MVLGSCGLVERKRGAGFSFTICNPTDMHVVTEAARPTEKSKKDTKLSKKGKKRSGKSTAEGAASGDEDTTPTNLLCRGQHGLWNGPHDS